MKIEFTRKNPPEEVAPSTQYPWGLRISLDPEMLEKFPEGTFSSIGQEMTIPMTARVVAMSEDEMNGKKERTVSLQIIAAELPETKKARNLYPETASDA